MSSSDTQSMTASLRSHASTRSVASSTSLKRDDFLFVLSWRGKKTRAKTSAELVEETGAVTNEEMRALQEYMSENEQYTQQLASEGWFSRDAQTVENYIETFIRERQGRDGELQYAPYNKPFGKLSEIVKITRMLKFYAMKGTPIRLRHVSLTDEQELALVQTEGVEIVVVNSGPGTGKTETSIHRASKLMDEGVIFVAFTNSAVDHAMRQLRKIVARIEDVDKKVRRHKDGEDGESIRPPKVLICTVDLLVGNAISKRVSMNVKADDKRTATSEDFETLVGEATEEIRLGRCKRFFHASSGGNVWNHIVVDEAQDLTSSRFRFLMAVLGSLRSEDNTSPRSISFFGDPRQRLRSDAGAEFQQLLTMEEFATAEEDGGERIPVRSLAFSKSFRFENTKLISLANALSSTRPSIHVDLTPAVECHLARPVKVFESPKDVAETVILLIRQSGVHPEQICLIMPAPKTGHRGTRHGDEIRSILATQSILCSDEGVWKEGLVFRGSIHSVKGLEFDYVFFLGANSFPEGFMSKLEVNDAASLNFVANTRARKELFMLSPDFTLPQNVPIELTENGKTARRYQFVYQPKSAVRSDDIDDADFRKFEAANEYPMVGNNGFQVFGRPQKALDRLPKPYTYEIISAVLASVNGNNVCQRLAERKTYRADVYDQNARAGICYDMMTSVGYMRVGDALVMREGTEKDVDKLSLRYPVEAIESHRLYHNLMKRTESALSDMKTIANNVMNIAALLETSDTDKTRPYHAVVASHIKASCIVSEKAVVVFSPSLHLASLAKVATSRAGGRRVYSVSLATGVVIEIVQAPYTIFRYANYLQSLYTIAEHVRLVREKQASTPFTKPIYLVDTEFLPITTGKASTVYDIAIINGVDPFASIVSMVDCGEGIFNAIQASRNRPGCKPLPFSYADFAGSPTSAQICTKFCSQLAALPSSERATLMYYNAAHDVSFLVGDKIQPNEDYGVDIVDAFRIPHIGGKGSLDQNYDRITMSDHSAYKHVIRHSAVGDTVLLWELVRRIQNPVADT